ncbi:MAG: S9 family peptidase [Solirubrobacterales bacterium]|nr:S9 family peptidase [Solirubrobacterales bacterium]
MALLDGSAPPRRLTRATGRSDRPRWSPGGASLAFRSDRRKRGVFGLYLLRLDGGEAEPLYVSERDVEHFAWSPDGAALALVVPDDPDENEHRRHEQGDDAEVNGRRWRYARLRVLDLDSREVRDVAAGEFHVSEAAWSPDGLRLAYLCRPTPELDARLQTVLCVAPATGGPAAVVCSAPRASGLVWSGDDGIMYTGPADDHWQSGQVLWSVDPAGAPPHVMAPESGEEACGLAVIAAHAQPVVIWLARGLDSCLEVVAAGGRRAPLQITTPRWWTEATVVWNERGPVIAMTGGNGEQPVEVWAGPAPELRCLSRHHESLSGVRFGRQQEFRWTAPDGLELDGLFVYPANAAAGPYPTVVLIHGGPYWRWDRRCHLEPEDWVQWLATAGYAVLAPNPRGGLGHGHEFAARVRGDVGGGDYADVMTAVDAAIERNLADPDRLGIGGWSQGGFMTAWAITQTDRFKAAVMSAGVSDWGMLTLRGDLPHFEAELSGSRPWDGPGPHRAAARSPISFANRVSTPLLILHGHEDARVPVSQAAGFHRALRDQDATVELVIYPREPHLIHERSHQRDMLHRVRAWYDRWIRDTTTD